MVTMIACATIPQLILLSYDQAALAAGNSRGFFFVTLIRAVLFIGLFLVGVHHAGIVGALVGQAAAGILAYPPLARLARRHGVWDPAVDVAFACTGIALVLGLALTYGLGDITAW